MGPFFSRLPRNSSTLKKTGEVRSEGHMNFGGKRGKCDVIGQAGYRRTVLLLKSVQTLSRSRTDSV